MPTYLIVAYQTAGGQPLRDAISEVSRRNRGVEFRLLVPATRIQHLFTWSTGEADAVAKAKADEVAQELRSVGVPLTDAVVGDPDPFTAVVDELAARPDVDGILVSTFPPGVSRWLRADLPSRLRKETGLPVIHVTADPET